MGYQHPKILFIAIFKEEDDEAKVFADYRSTGLLTLTTLPLQGNAEEKESEHLRATLHVIRIGWSAVFPGTAKVKANEAVAWTNYSGTVVEIRFNKEAVKKLQCKEQSPFQMIEDDSVLSSGEVHFFEVITLC